MLKTFFKLLFILLIMEIIQQVKQFQIFSTNSKKKNFFSDFKISFKGKIDPNFKNDLKEFYEKFSSQIKNVKKIIFFFNKINFNKSLKNFQFQSIEFVMKNRNSMIISGPGF